MNWFKIGYNFDAKLVDVIQYMNRLYAGKSRITEVYGSIREHAWLTARPDFRLPDVSVRTLDEHVGMLKDIGVKFNYTLNTPFPGSREWLRTHAVLLSRVLHDIQFAGVIRVTVANPLLMQLIREYTESHFEFDVSTIAHIDTVTQIKYLHEQYYLGGGNVCFGIHKNRAFRWLQAAADYCKSIKAEPEILVNEFCAVGGVGYTTHCPHRDSCYLLHATDKTLEETKEFSGYPMQHCIASRNKDPVSWLRTRFVRPQDLVYYNDVGIYKFKLSGRTGTTEYMKMILNAYMSGNYDGNLLALWKPLETITSKEDELKFSHAVEIPCNKLDGFLDQWATYRNFDCANVLCGTDCRYCDEFYKEHVRNENEDNIDRIK